MVVVAVGKSAAAEGAGAAKNTAVVSTAACVCTVATQATLPSTTYCSRNPCYLSGKWVFRSSHHAAAAAVLWS